MRKGLWIAAVLVIALALVFAGCASSGGGKKTVAEMRSGDKSAAEGYTVTVLRQQDLNQHTEVYFDELVAAKPGSGVYFFFIKENSNMDGIQNCAVIGPDWSEAPNPGNYGITIPMGTGKNTLFRIGPLEPADVVSWEAGWAPGRTVLGAWANSVLGLDRVELWEPNAAAVVEEAVESEE